MTMKHTRSDFTTDANFDNSINPTVQKSMLLFALWKSKLTLAESKILDVYLSRIDIENSNKREVRFEKGELEKILEVKKINISELKKRLGHLRIVIEVDNSAKTGSFNLVSLFEQIKCEQDEYGQWQIDLKCTQDAMKYILSVESLDYLRYELHSIVKLKSRYSYILFLYLEQNRFRKTWEISVDDLRRILNCEDNDFYGEFRYFNQRILKRCQNELQEKTNCKFTYKLIKKGRSVVSIRFDIETLPNFEL